MSDLKDALESGTIVLPDPEPLPDDDRDVPYFIIGGDAFPSKAWLMKPFSGRNLTEEERIFNYRLTRARRIVENAFGILANRFQCLFTTLQHDPDTVKSLVMSCICLHFSPLRLWLDTAVFLLAFIEREIVRGILMVNRTSVIDHFTCVICLGF